MQAAIGGTTDGSVIYNTYVNDVLFSSSGTLYGPAFDDVQLGYLTAAAPYKLTIEAILMHAAAMQISSFDAEFKKVAVPDGGATNLLLGIGFLASCAFRRWARK